MMEDTDGNPSVLFIENSKLKWMTAKEAAAYIRVSVSQLRNMGGIFFEVHPASRG